MSLVMRQRILCIFESRNARPRTRRRKVVLDQKPVLRIILCNYEMEARHITEHPPNRQKCYRVVLYRVSSRPMGNFEFGIGNDSSPKNNRKRPPSPCQAHLIFSDRLLYPEGIMALSPGLRRKELPWVTQLTDLFNRNAVAAGWIALGARAATPFALESFFGPNPR